VVVKATRAGRIADRRGLPARLGVEIHSMVLDLGRSWLNRTGGHERYQRLKRQRLNHAYCVETPPGNYGKGTWMESIHHSVLK
jgi:hypothetical protein